MQVSANVVKRVVLAANLLMPLAIGLWIWTAVTPDNAPLSVASFVAWIVLAVVIIVAAGIALTYFGGLLKISCPNCGRPCQLVSSGPRYTSICCPNCGDLTKFRNVDKE